ncbi:MAG: hypothetical protein GYB68_19285 [Chloroflexi bacterium]|nr:hypothetical protein [Chloroflexota bacterium]
MIERLKAFFSDYPDAAILAGLFALLATLYSLTTPIFEASDEIFHYPVVQHIAATGSLPVQDPEVETLWVQQGSQPPLYYLISAGLTFWIDASDLPELRWLNPHAKLGVPGDPDNTNMIIHTERERFPWRGSVLAVHLVRLFSVGLGTISVVLAYLLTLEFLGEQRWLRWLTVGLMAFNPMFLFISGSVNNDNLLVLLSTWGLLLSVRILKDGITWQRTLTIGAVAAAASLTKISGLTLMPIIGLVWLIVTLRNGDWALAIRTGLAFVGIWIVVAGWWYLRNIMLYDELFGINMMVAIAGPRPPISLIELLRSEWYPSWVGYWAWFGGVNILPPTPMLAYFGLLQGAGLVGLIVWFVQISRRGEAITWAPLGLLVLHFLITLASYVNWTSTTFASQGRLLFPAISSLSLLTALGLLAWMPEKRRREVALVLSAGLLAIAVATPFAVIRPAYAPPSDLAELPDGLGPIDVAFDELELVAVHTERVDVLPGEQVPITLYWRLTESTERNISLFLTAFGRDMEEIGSLVSYPGGGALPTSLMDPGQIIEDRYWIGIDDDVRTPSLLRLQIGAGLFDGEQFNVIDPAGGGAVIVEAGSIQSAEGLSLIHI